MENCLTLNGTLPDERVARMAANMAVDQVGNYFRNCEVHSTHDYCEKLIERALDIETRKRKKTE